ncbi:MAG: hypothetical protein QW227_01400 [Candidatus Aenigmatarchaeota archaeon]|nr:hypothetical protein [Candidatus Aenigmarchaeota archaeon]
MPVTIKLDKGFVKKLADVGNITPEMSKDLSGEELTAQILDPELVIQKHPGKPPLLEIADVNGSFGVWVELRADKIRRLKEIAEKL